MQASYNAEIERLRAAFARVDALHQPRQAVQRIPCRFHARAVRLPDDCPACTGSPIIVCRNITCCGWPCAAHLELHDETPDTCTHRPA